MLTPVYHALKDANPVLPVFIFDKDILDHIDDRDDARVTFIHETITALDDQLQQLGSCLLVLHDKAADAWQTLLSKYNVAAVYTNHDYEPIAKNRDADVARLLSNHNIAFYTFKDQVIFEKDEVVKDDGKPYTVFTPYSRKWRQTLNAFYLEAYPNKNILLIFIRPARCQYQR